MTILWIDDDGVLLESQKRQISDAGYQLSVVQTVDEAWKVLNAPGATFKGIILDVMMATGALLKDSETNGGLLTGERFLEEMNKAGLLTRHPIFIYTITQNPSTNELARQYNISCYRKHSYPGKQLVKLIDKHFGKP